MIKRSFGILLLAGSLSFVAGCGGDDCDKYYTPTTTPGGNTPTSPPATATSPPVDTRTATNTPAPGDDTPTPTPTEEPSEGLGERVFSAIDPEIPPAQPQEFLRSGLFSSGLGGGNVTAAIDLTMTLVAGAPDANGVAPLSLKEDTILTALPIDGSFACTIYYAEGSSGSIDCDGGSPYDVLATQPAGDLGTDVFDIETGLGGDAGPGAATLIVMATTKNFPVGSPEDICFTGPHCFENGNQEPCYPEPWLQALTTATGSAMKGSTAQSVIGENFICNEWTVENSDGMLVLPAPTYNALVGDTSNAFRFADRSVE